LFCKQGAGLAAMPGQHGFFKSMIDNVDKELNINYLWV
jgi:hypothetical protein